MSNRATSQKRCGRAGCQLVLSRHVHGKCPRGGKTWWEPGSRKPFGRGPRMSMSWSEAERLALQEVLRQLQRGGDPRLIAKMHSRALGGVLGKLERARMRAQALPAAARESAPEDSPQPVADEALRAVAGRSQEGV